jgi:hypothetical protein
VQTLLAECVEMTGASFFYPFAVAALLVAAVAVARADEPTDYTVTIGRADHCPVGRVPLYSGHTFAYREPLYRDSITTRPAYGWSVCLPSDPSKHVPFSAVAVITATVEAFCTLCVPSKN